MNSISLFTGTTISIPKTAVFAKTTTSSARGPAAGGRATVGPRSLKRQGATGVVLSAHSGDPSRDVRSHAMSRDG